MLEPTPIKLDPCGSPEPEKASRDRRIGGPAPESGATGKADIGRSPDPLREIASSVELRHPYEMLEPASRHV